MAGDKYLSPAPVSYISRPPGRPPADPVFCRKCAEEIKYPGFDEILCCVCAGCMQKDIESRTEGAFKAGRRGNTCRTG